MKRHFIKNKKNTPHKALLGIILCEMFLIAGYNEQKANASIITTAIPEIRQEIEILAINTNKDEYAPGENIKIQATILDNFGNMVCDSDVVIDVIKEGKIYKTLNTIQPLQNNTNALENELLDKNTFEYIKVNKIACNTKNFTKEHDYEANLTLSEEGQYTLIFRNKNGNKYSQNTILVKNVDQDKIQTSVERISNTRIFPPEDYTMKIKIKPTESFDGQYIETLPKGFDILNIEVHEITKVQNEDSDTLNKETTIRLVQKTSINNAENINTSLSDNTIVWEGYWDNKKEYELIYVYKAPNISPMLYEIKPLKVIQNQYDKENTTVVEDRSWQIAADAIGFVQSISNVARAATTVSATLGATATSGNLLVLFCGSAAANTISENSATYTPIINNSGTPSHASFYKISDGTETGAQCNFTASDNLGVILIEYSGIDTSTPLDNSNTATGSGDATAECPSVTPSAGNHLFVSGLTFNSNSSISTWSNSFTEREDVNTGTGPGSGRIHHAAADLFPATGAQSTVATSGATGAWRCHTLAFNEAPPVTPAYTQNDFEWYVTADSVTLSNIWPSGNGDDIAENAALTQIPATNEALETGDQIRIQMNFTVATSAVTASSQAFKLQYDAAEDCTTASGWTDVGAKASGSIWRLFDEASIGDSTTQVNNISTSTGGAEGYYSEINASATNPNAIAIGETSEWDWPVENNGATPNTSYCFRMVLSDDTPLDSYNSDSYPKLTTAPGASDLMRHGNFYQNDVERGFFWTN